MKHPSDLGGSQTPNVLVRSTAYYNWPLPRNRGFMCEFPIRPTAPSSLKLNWLKNFQGASNISARTHMTKFTDHCITPHRMQGRTTCIFKACCVMMKCSLIPPWVDQLTFNMEVPYRWTRAVPDKVIRYTLRI